MPRKGDRDHGVYSLRWPQGGMYDPTKEPTASVLQGDRKTHWVRRGLVAGFCDRVHEAGVWLCLD